MQREVSISGVSPERKKATQKELKFFFKVNEPKSLHRKSLHVPKGLTPNILRNSNINFNITNYSFKNISVERKKPPAPNDLDRK